MAGFLVTLTGGHVKEKSKVNVYVEGEQEHNSCAVALPDKRKNATADASSIQEDIAIGLGIASY